MRIKTINKIQLEDKEVEALNELINIYEKCANDDRFDCKDCPLHLPDEYQTSLTCLSLVAQKTMKGNNE